MTLGERIRACRQSAGLSQEKVAELVGVSRQAVTKWEAGQSAPSTENLFKLAEVLGTTVDLLLMETGSESPSLAGQIYRLYELEAEKKRVGQKRQAQKNAAAALLVVLGYLAIYLTGRLIWCTSSETSLMGWLVLAAPAGENSYLYGWLLSSGLFWAAMALSVLPALLGKYRFSLTTLAAFLIGLLLGMGFGPNPGGAFYGNTHYGWAIWGGIFLFSIPMGIALEKLSKGTLPVRSKKLRIWGAVFLLGTAAVVLLVRASIP